MYYTKNGRNTSQAYIEQDSLSQNVHPNDIENRRTLDPRNSGNSKVNKTVGFKEESGKITIPKIKGKKSGVVTICSSKKSSSKGRKKKFQAKSSKISHRLHKVGLVSSMSSLPQSINHYTNIRDSSNDKNRTITSNYTSELLSKYENDNRDNVPELTDYDRRMLTQKALTSEGITSDERIRPLYIVGSTGSESLNNSSRVVRNLLPYNQKGINPLSVKSDTSYINLVNEDNGLGAGLIYFDPITNVVIHETSQDSKSTQKYKSSESRSKSGSRSKSTKKRAKKLIVNKKLR